MKILLTIFTLIFIISCSSQKLESPKEYKNSIIDSLAYSKYGKNYSSQKNKSGEFLICRKVYKKKNPDFNPVDFFVYSINENEIIFSRKVHDGKVNWSDEYIVEIISYLGISKLEGGSIKKEFYDCINKEMKN